MRSIKIILLVLFPLCGVSVDVLAQNSTNSPYTRFGYGRLESPVFGRAQGMGGLGISLRSKSCINPANPASYSSVDSMTFMFEVGASGALAHFSDEASTYTTGNANLDYLAAQFSITKWMGASFGLIPFSSVGYNFGSTDSITVDSSDPILFKRNYSGSGGVSQVYLGLSFNLWKRLSLGVNAYYLFGEMSHVRSLAYSSSAYQSTSYTSNLHVGSFNFRYGIQYTERFAKKHALTLGLAYENRSKLKGTYEEIMIGTDTVSTPSSLENQMQLPSFYGVGLSYAFDNRLTVGIDYSLQEFSKAKYFGATDSLLNKSKLVIGAEYVHNPYSTKYVDRMCWRLGGNLTNSYISPGMLDYGISLGIGFPLRTSKTMLNIALEYDKIGRAAKNAIREDYFKFTFNATINESWFYKKKI